MDGIQLIEPVEDQLPLPAGFERFNLCPTLCVDVPNGGFTLSCRTEDGKQVTFHFGVYQKDGTPQFLDIQYHNNGTSWDNGGRKVSTFDAIMFGGGNTLHDTRKNKTGPSEGKAAIICVLMEDKEEAK